MNALCPRVERDDALQTLARVVLDGDLSRLTPAERVAHYNATCQSLGLNPFTRPFEYLRLNNKLVLYVRKDATDQLRNLHSVSLAIVDRKITDGLCIVTARATLPSGRQDEDIGAVPLDGLRGEALANAIMKAITKAKRRVALSVCGLGCLDESEIASIAGAEPLPAPIWQAMAWPVLARDGTACDCEDADSWEAEFSSRIAHIKQHPKLSHDLKGDLLEAVRNANRAIFAHLRERGYDDAVAAVEAQFAAALGIEEAVA